MVYFLLEMIAEVILATILRDLIKPKEDEFDSDAIEVQTFDDEAEMQARIWNCLVRKGTDSLCEYAVSEALMSEDFDDRHNPVKSSVNTENV
jgi:hypothetical protein